MSQPQASYILQYISGMVNLPVNPDLDEFEITGQANFSLVNRGTSAQTAQIQIWTTLQNTPIYNEEVVVGPNNGTTTVVPVAAVVGTAALGWANQWVEIRTASPDVVPSCAFYGYFPDAAVSGQTPLMFYFAPGDFAQFTLHLIDPTPPRPPTPPIAP
jgi:hypothetical protein